VGVVWRRCVTLLPIPAESVLLTRGRRATDPYLVGEAAYETVKGIQSTGVQANAKHFIGNEEEHNRTYSSSNIDDRTMHEIYLHPFLKAVQADVASVMCSYSPSLTPRSFPRDPTY
jgi:beta-glucosidase-like glycosyl hydrolase